MRLTFPAALLLAPMLLTAQDTRHVTEPRIPSACTTLVAALSAPGAVLPESDEARPDTRRIQQVMDGCAPGKAVVLKADARHNAFLSGPLDLRRGVTLVVERGAILLASRNPKDYELSPGSCGTVDHGGKGCRAMINGDGVADAGVMGDGVIDGRGGAKMTGRDMAWWDLAEKARKVASDSRPHLLVLSGCDNFTLYRITLRNSPHFHVSYREGHGFTVWGVKIYAPEHARNTDGIDPGNSTDVTITRCYIHAGDDNVAIKAHDRGPTTHMTVAHNHFYTGHGMSIGSQTEGGASAIRVSDLSIDGAKNGLRIKSNSGRGGLVHDVVYEDVCIRNTKNPILMDTDYQHFGPGGDKLPTFQDITLRNVRIIGDGKVRLNGFDATHRLGIAFDNVLLDQPDSVKMAAAHATVTLGPGPTNLHPSGDDVTVTGNPGQGEPNACQNKFVDFPEDGASK
jgi:polygalacturonase